MLLTFKVFKEKIENGEKFQTIRKFTPERFRRLMNCWKKRETTGRYNLFWHNPRNGGTRIRDVVPSDRPFLITFNGGIPCVQTVSKYVQEHNPSFHQDIAIADGFRNSKEMFAWFGSEYGHHMYQEKFIVIRWKR